MELSAYLERIAYTGPVQANEQTLIQIHRHHLLEISYENLDIQLGRRVDLDLKSIYSKIVENGRGGWCYEMNGLLEWALREIGFRVKRVNGGVARDVRGDKVVGNHLVLLVDLGNTWVADVGFGDGFLEPIPLSSGAINQRGFEYFLEHLPDGYWRLHNHKHGSAPTYDFAEGPADEQLFFTHNKYLQTSEESQFVMNLTCQRFVEDGYQIQLGRVARHVTPSGIKSWLIEDADQLVGRLRSDFNLDVPELASIWPQIVERHEKLFPAAATGSLASGT